jgi:hypothetical protein
MFGCTDLGVELAKQSHTTPNLSKAIKNVTPNYKQLKSLTQ